MGGHYCLTHFMGYLELTLAVLKYFAAIFLGFSLFSCQQNDSNTSTNIPSGKIETTHRIITLAPHLTELLFSIGVGDRIIATVEYSDYPEPAKDIPRIGDAFRIDWEKLAQLDPDLILVWEGGNPKNVIDELQRRNYRVVKYANASLFNLADQIQELGELLNVPTVAIAQEYSQGLKVLTEIYAKKQAVDVFYQISAQPIYSIGSAHTISEMLQVCGARNVFSNSAKLPSPLSPEAVIGANPDVVLTSNFSYEEVRNTWNKLGIIKQKNILKVPGDEVSRASLRMLQGVKNICEELDEWRQENENISDMSLEITH